MNRRRKGFLSPTLSSRWGGEGEEQAEMTVSSRVRRAVSGKPKR